jgi:hypothetical protein
MRDMTKFAMILRFNLLWLFVTALVLAGFSLPILMVDFEFEMWIEHIVFIVTFMVAFRYIFFLRHSWIAHLQYVKISIFFLCLWGTFLLIDAFFDFRTYIDEDGLQSALIELPHVDQDSLSRFITQEMLFFGIGSIISTIMLGLRMIHSVWRWHNYKQV